MGGEVKIVEGGMIGDRQEVETEAAEGRGVSTSDRSDSGLGVSSGDTGVVRLHLGTLRG